MLEGYEEKNADMKKVVVFFGLIASGKSFAAKAWVAKHHFPYANTDVVRKQLAGRRSCQPHPDAFAQGIYSPAFSRRTYDAMLSFTEKALQEQAVSCVVLDGSYQARAERERLLASFTGRARIVFILCGCREEVIKDRLQQRALDPAAVSDGNWTIYLNQKKVFESPEELPIGQLWRLDTEKTTSELVAALDVLLLNET